MTQPSPGRPGSTSITAALDMRAPRRGPANAAVQPRVAVDTALGEVVLEVLARHAPLTAANFLRYVDDHHLDGCSIYRIATPHHRQPQQLVSASVIQWGMRSGQRGTPPFPPIAHEPTSMTGLTHCHGAVSLARLAPGTGSSEFFFCVGDQPQLDFGGRRHPDGEGFAVFGQVVAGEAVLSAIYARAEADHLLQQPIPIRAVRRLA